MFSDTTGFDFGRSVVDECRVATPLATRLRDSRASLSLRWLERISARVTIDDDDVFPSQDLLDHVPLLIEAIADYLENPAEDAPAAGAVLSKAAELGQMRFEQGFGPHQILKEFELLGGIVLSYLSRASDTLPVDCPPGELMVCAQRVHRALAMIQQASAARYLALLETHANEREQRLRALNDVLSGPLRERLGELLTESRAGDPAAAFASIRMRAGLENVAAAVEQLRLLSSVAPSARLQRNVPLRAAVAESVRTVRDAARERGVAVRAPDPLPELEVNAGPVELALLVFLNTLIRHGQSAARERSIEVRALAESAAEDAIVQLSICDAGGLLSPLARRALEEATEPSTGSVAASDAERAESASVQAGLEIARNAIEGLGGRITIRITEQPPSTEFVLHLPARRSEDRPLV